MRNDKSEVDSLIEEMQKADEIIKENCIYLLGEIGAEACQLSANTLKDSTALAKTNVLCDPEYRKKVLHILVNEFKSKEGWIRGNAADALGKIGDPSVLPQIAGLLMDKDRIVRYSAAEAMGSINDQSATKYLVEALDDEDWGVRLSIVKALGKLKDPNSVPALRDALSDSRHDVKLVAEEALELIETSGAVKTTSLTRK